MIGNIQRYATLTRSMSYIPLPLVSRGVIVNVSGTGVTPVMPFAILAAEGNIAGFDLPIHVSDLVSSIVPGVEQGTLL